MELDSLELKVSAEAQSAEKALDSLIGKLQSFSKALGGINTTSISKNLENLAKVGGLKTVAKEVEDLGKTVDNVGKKKTKTEVKVDVKQGLEAIKELQNKFSDIGKGTQFNGNLSSLEKEYDKLSAKLDKLAEREQKALAIGTASTNDKAFQSLQYDIANTINKLAELETKIQSVKNQNTSQTANIPIFRWDNQNTGSTQNITENIEKSLKSIPETAKYSVEQAQKSLNEAISKVQNAQTNVEDFSQRISQARANLKNVEVSGKGMGTDEWDRAYIALQKVVSEAKQYKAALNERATGINTDISETDSLDTKVNKLREDLKQLKADGFGFGDTAFDKTYQQLNQAEKELAEYKARLTESENSTRSFGSTLKSAATGFSNFISKIKNAGAATLNFAKNVRNMKSPLKLALGQISKLGNSVARLYFKYMLLSRVAGALGKVLGISSDYVEEYNYFQKAIDKIAQENKGNYKKYGYDDAESYANSFEDRLTTLTGKMTGYKPDKNGNLIDTDVASLGLDITQITNFEAQIAQMTNSVGMMGEASIATSKAMTMLAGDMSSLTNMPLDTVMKNFSSGLSGAAMAVKKYGMDISVAALQETALGLGVKKNISDMTQAEKEYLRVITMLQQSKVAWGDLAKTINSPANQFRMLKSNIKQCGLMLSRLFMPVIEKVLPWLNAMAMAVKDLMKHIGDLFGLKFKSIGGSSNDDTSSSYDDVSDSADDAADSINNAADAQKKFNKQLQGFDKLNNLTTNETSKGDNDSDKGNTGDTSGVLSDALINAVEDYEKRWNEAFKSMTSNADKLKEKIETLFKNAWDAGDGTEIGEALATTLNKGIDYVNEHQSEWSSGLNKITSIMGTTLNGFIKKFKWEGLGQAIGGSIKTALEAETNFFETVNWVNLGKGLSSTLNSAIETGVLQSYFKSMASKLRAAIETAFGAITTFKFDKLGEALGQGINDFFDKMGKVNPKTNKNGWQELATTISEGIQGVATTITTALKTVKWEDVGQAIADFIKDIKWGKVIWKLGGMATSLFSAIVDAVSTIVEKAPLESAIVGLFATLKLTGIDKYISTAIQVALMNKNLSLGKIVLGLSLAGATFKLADSEDKVKSCVMAPITAFMASKTFGVSTKLSLGIAGVTLAATGGFSLGKLIGDELSKVMSTEDMSEYRYNFKFSDLFSYSPSEWAQGIADWIVDIQTTFGEKKDEIQEAISGLVDDIYTGDFKLTIPFTGITLPSYNEWTEALSTWWGKVKTWWGEKYVEIKGKISDAAEKIKTWWGNFKEGTKTVWAKAKGTIDKTWKSVKKAWGDFKTRVKSVFVKAKGAVDSTWKSVKEAWGKFKEGTKTVLAKAKGSIDNGFKNIGKAWNSFKETTKELWANAKGKIESTWNNVQTAWNDFKEGTKNLFVSADGAIQDGFKTVSSKWADFKEGTKNALIKAKGDIGKSFNIASEKWKAFSENAKKNVKNAILKLLGNPNSSSYKKVKEMYDKFRSKTATLSAKAREIGANIFKKIKKGWNDIGSKTATLTATFRDFFTAPLKKAWNAIAGAINKGLKVINKIPAVNIPMIPKLAKGGIFAGGSWHNIAKYANGGTPNMGQLFYAREAGPELVGTLKGRGTAVMNNDQIVASVSQGVSDAVYNVMTPVLTSLVSSINRMNSSGTPLYVEGVSEGDIVKITQNANADYKKRYGKPLFT